MARIILAAGRRFGRFAVFLLVPPAAIIIALWLSLLDDHPGWFLGLAFIILPFVTITASFLAGTLVAGIQRSKISGLKRSEAPGLCSAWEAVVGPSTAKRTTIVLDDELNASVRVERILFGLLGERYILSVGIPLLAVTDTDAMVAIFAHENAHLRNKDVNGALRLAEFEKTFHFVFSYASPESTISGRLLYSLLGLLSDSFQRETSRLSWQAEIKADQQAASHGRSKEAARALLLVAAATEFLNEQVYQPLHHEVLGAISPPVPPLTRVLGAVGRLTDPEVLNGYALQAWNLPEDDKASHPSLARRLSALGYPELLEIAPVTTTALSLLEKNTADRLAAAFDEAWTNRIADQLQW
ncbi:M48 family metalloprotease [Agrobacterium sp. LAD9]|uniref:M48 family metalloprotease n=1 Tax=Agrobacterium sp. LAD9 TaxID=2055153 RepID=UPI000D1E6AD4|nr:M48 family metalloprotease [Agrobacterium sp. LAD9]